MREGLPAALLLDLDGTLVDSEPLNRLMYDAFFAARGWRVDEETGRMFVGRRADDVFSSEPGPWSDEDPAALLAEVLTHFPATLLPSPLPGAHRLMAAARTASIPLALVTSAHPAWVRRCLTDALDVPDAFDALVTREDVAVGKPHPECYLSACSRLGVAPAGCWAAEDAPSGIRAAVAAGVGEVFGICSTFDADALRAAGAHHQAADLDDLASRLTVA